MNEDTKKIIKALENDIDNANNYDDRRVIIEDYKKFMEAIKIKAEVLLMHMDV